MAYFKAKLKIITSINKESNKIALKLNDKIYHLEILDMSGNINISSFVGMNVPLRTMNVEHYKDFYRYNIDVRRTE